LNCFAVPMLSQYAPQLGPGRRRDQVSRHAQQAFSPGRPAVTDTTAVHSQAGRATPSGMRQSPDIWSIGGHRGPPSLTVPNPADATLWSTGLYGHQTLRLPREAIRYGQMRNDPITTDSRAAITSFMSGTTMVDEWPGRTAVTMVTAEGRGLLDCPGAARVGRQPKDVEPAVGQLRMKTLSSTYNELQRAVCGFSTVFQALPYRSKAPLPSLQSRRLGRVHLPSCELGVNASGSRRAGPWHGVREHRSAGR
jgi:hypothetical protein